MNSRKSNSENPYIKLNPEMGKVIVKNEKKYDLYLGEIIKTYGVLFALRLIKLSTKDEKNHRPETKRIEMIWPEKVKKATRTNKDVFNKEFYEYIEKVEEAGFKIAKIYEPFTDEDTGEMFVIHRHYIYFLNN